MTATSTMTFSRLGPLSIERDKSEGGRGLLNIHVNLLLSIAMGEMLAFQGTKFLCRGGRSIHLQEAVVCEGGAPQSTAMGPMEGRSSTHHVRGLAQPIVHGH